jgi:hypothetical protein
LRLRGRWVSNDADIDIAAKVHSFRRLLVYASHKLQQETFFDNFVAVDGRSNTRDQTIVNSIAVNHRLEFIELGCRESVEERLAAVSSDIFFASDIRRATLKNCQMLHAR